MFQDNNWYGNRYILSRYLKEKDKTIFASIQHGYIFFGENLKLKKRKIESAPWLVWNDFLNLVLKKNGHKNIFSIGAPFLYLDKILKYKKKSYGTLVIPSKSAYEIDIVIDYENLYKFVKKKFKPPYAILVGYNDLKRVNKIRNNFKNCKFITCGKRTNKYFTFNLYNYLTKYKNVVHFYPGSPLFYSIFLKKKTYYFKKRFVKNLKGKGALFGKNKELKLLKEEDDKIVKNIKKEIGLDFKNLNSPKNYIKARTALGYNCIKPKNELRKLLGWHSNIKIFISLILKIFIFVRHLKAHLEKI